MKIFSAVLDYVKCTRTIPSLFKIVKRKIEAKANNFSFQHYCSRAGPYIQTELRIIVILNGSGSDFHFYGFEF